MDKEPKKEQRNALNNLSSVGSPTDDAAAKDYLEGQLSEDDSLADHYDCPETDDGIAGEGDDTDDHDNDDSDIFIDAETELATLSDEELLVRIRSQQDTFALEFLIKKYRNFVRVRARSYFLIGADREDIIQEGMIGLYKAIRDFRDEKLSSFRAFAELCVTRQIITAIKTATRQKHIPLNSYISLNKPIYDEDSDRTLLDILSGTAVSDPEELMINREEFLNIEYKMEQILSDLEWRVLMSYLDGKSYQEIAVDLNRRVKSIDNALQRVKRKLEKYMDSRTKAELEEAQGKSSANTKHLGDMYFNLDPKR